MNTTDHIAVTNDEGRGAYEGPAGQAWRHLRPGTYAAHSEQHADLRLEVTAVRSSVGEWPAGIDPREYAGPDVEAIATRDGWGAPEWEAYLAARSTRDSGAEPLTIYTAEDCQACRMTKRALDKAGIAYELIDIADLPQAILDQLRDQGHQQLPVVTTGTERWSGFRPDKLKTLDTPNREN